MGQQELFGGNLKVWEETVEGKGPFPGSSKLFRCSNGLEKARHGSLLEHTVGVLMMAGKNELLCANVGSHILVLR